MVQKKATKYLFYVLCGFIFSAQYEFETSLHIMYLQLFCDIVNILCGFYKEKSTFFHKHSGQFRNPKSLCKLITFT